MGSGPVPGCGRPGALALVGEGGDRGGWGDRAWGGPLYAPFTNRPRHAGAAHPLWWVPRKRARQHRALAAATFVRCASTCVQHVQKAGAGRGSGWALRTQSRHRWWAGLTFFKPAGQWAVEGGGRWGSGGTRGGGGGAPSVVLPRLGGVGAKRPSPFLWSPTGGQPTACTLAWWWLHFGPIEAGSRVRR